MWSTFCRIWPALGRDESGATATEYAIMLAIIVLGTFAAMSAFADRVTILTAKLPGELPDA